ncbi:porin family protein [Sulfurovum lithotrophicum]|uniref:porin family protein n=1 Tax=Sulfurovum lithotrophicum TaxID=206403 RepID=UPI000695D920|nr:porin family protein [Sulfurovum lithotrophicum]
MKKLNLSLAAIFAIGTFAVAGGDIAPVEPVVEAPVVESTGNFYIGGAYGYGDMDVSDAGYSHDENFDSFMLQAGYKFNPYIAVEGRYWWTSGNDWDNSGEDFSADSWGIYVKPMYPVTNELDIYALLGYGDTDPEIGGSGPDYDTDGFQWGLGASYDVTENVAVFVDYVSLYDDTNDGEDLTIDTVNFGVTYNF